VKTVTVTPYRVTLTVTQRQQLYAVVSQSDGTVLPIVDLRWASSDSTVASVNVLGLVEARQAGTAIVTAADTSGVVGQSQVTVTAQSFLSVSKIRVANVPSRWLVQIPVVVPGFPVLPVGTGLYQLDLMTGADTTVAGHAFCAVSTP